MKEKRARLARIDPIAPDVLELDFLMVDPPQISFRAGQFVSLRLPGGVGERRSYSLASRAGRTDGFALLIRQKGGSGSRFISALDVGDEIEFFGPMGYFLVDQSHPGAVVFAATGVGGSAIFPMMEEVIARERAPLHFFWGLETPRDLFWGERLAELEKSGQLTTSIRFAREGDGFITEAVVATADSLKAPTYYLCGNGLMVRDVRTGLRAAGVNLETRVRTEAFAPPASPERGEAS